MEVLRTIDALRAQRADWTSRGETVALVPTMGAIHQGHMALVEHAKTLSDRVIATIFINPTQFAPGGDFDAYPRTEDADTKRLASAGADALFAPELSEIYPPGFATNISVSGVSDGLCGGHRPGHFDGVATVVSKLLLQATPDTALFGEKDYQQLQVIRRVVTDLDIPVRIIGVPTVREADGLAMSSRNAYLTDEERRIAPALYQTLTKIADDLKQGAAVEELLEKGTRSLTEAGFRSVDYLELRDANSLAILTKYTGPARLLAAAWLGKARLIDNIEV